MTLLWINLKTISVNLGPDSHSQTTPNSSIDNTRRLNVCRETQTQND